MNKLNKLFYWILIIFVLSHTSSLYAKPKIIVKSTDNRSIEINSMQNEKRIALVIGNGTYKNIKTLKNPVNDASAMVKVLEGLHFKVLRGFDLTQKEMKRLISQFGDEIRDGGVGLFYFAGHGIQINGENYLIPIDADVHSEKDVIPEAVNANDVLINMAYAKNRLNIVILDACRDNPFKGFRSAFGGGLAQMKAPEGTFIAYSTAPGSVASDGEGKNGLYTQELIKNMEKPGVQIEQMFKGVRESVRNLSNERQIPWESSSIIGDFYFKIDSNMRVSNMSVPTMQNNIDVDKEYWDTIKSSTDVSDFKEFLSKFPNSVLTEVAQAKINQLEKIQPLTPTKETKISSRPIKIKNSLSSDGRFTDNGDGTIFDINTGLMWTKKDSYAEIGRCFNWNNSRKYVSELQTGGYRDWRLPTVDELKNIYEQSKTNTTYDGGRIHLDPIFADGGSYWYWSLEENGNCCARGVAFNDGSIGSGVDRGGCRDMGVRAVRAGH